MKKIAIMQPYVFPYIGYFQLIHAADTFVFYDDVNFIKQGWINRNRILINGADQLFSIPVESISSFKKINEVEIKSREFKVWKNKFIKTLKQSYHKAPYFKLIFPFIVDILEKDLHHISTLAKNSITEVLHLLNINRNVIESSVKYNNSFLKAQDRVIDICKQENASVYINVPGGVDLYDQHVFKSQELALHFIQPNIIHYKQFNHEFVPWLSIIDILMFNDIAKIKEDFLPHYFLK